MRYDAFYLIRPKERLVRELSGYPADTAESLLEARLWSCGEGGRTVWGVEEYEARIKLLFMADLVTECSQSAEFRQLVSGLTVSVASFDERWSLERYLVDETCESVEARLDPEAVNSMVAPDMPVVAEWVSYLGKKASDRDG